MSKKRMGKDVAFTRNSVQLSKWKGGGRFGQKPGRGKKILLQKKKKTGT